MPCRVSRQGIPLYRSRLFNRWLKKYFPNRKNGIWKKREAVAMIWVQSGFELHFKERYHNAT